MTKEEIELVENALRQDCPPGMKVLEIVTIQNKVKYFNMPAFLTHVKIEDEKTGLQGSVSHNTLKRFREIKKKEKYKDVL
jgi:hypothetical protein